MQEQLLSLLRIRAMSRRSNSGGFLGEILSALSTILYALLIGLILYIGYYGFLKVFNRRATTEENENIALKAAGIHSLVLVGIFLKGLFSSSDAAMEFYIEVLGYGILYSLLFVVVGFILHILIEDKD